MQIKLNFVKLLKKDEDYLNRFHLVMILFVFISQESVLLMIFRISVLVENFDLCPIRSQNHKFIRNLSCISHENFPTSSLYPILLKYNHNLYCVTDNFVLPFDAYHKTSSINN